MVQNELKKLSNIWFVKTQQRAIRGTPDLICCVGGIFVALELKRDQKAKADPLQRWNLSRINKCKGIGLVVYPENFEKVLNVIKILSERGTYDRGNMGSIEAS